VYGAHDSDLLDDTSVVVLLNAVVIVGCRGGLLPRNQPAAGCEDGLILSITQMGDVHRPPAAIISF
jgi:hypothetical protein